jgi:hypothetical protein
MIGTAVGVAVPVAFRVSELDSVCVAEGLAVTLWVALAVGVGLGNWASGGTPVGKMAIWAIVGRIGSDIRTWY